MSKTKTAKNVIDATATLKEGGETPAHVRFLTLWKEMRDRRANVRAKRKAAFLAANPAAVGKGADTKKSSKEGFEYPAIVGETADDHAALAYCAAMERAEKVTGVNFITMLSECYALGVAQGAAPVEDATAGEPGAGEPEAQAS